MSASCSESRLEKLLQLSQVVRATQLAAEAYPFSRLAGGFSRGVITELSGPAGCGKTELTLQFLAENPQLRVAWIEGTGESCVYPAAFPLQSVALDRLLFCLPPHSDLVWASLQIFRSGVFDVVVICPPVAITPTDLRRLQLAAEQARVVTLLISEKPTSAGAWTLRHQFQVIRKRSEADERILLHPLKRVSSAPSRTPDHPFTQKTA